MNSIIYMYMHVKARHVSDSAFSTRFSRLGVPAGWEPLDLGEINLHEIFTWLPCSFRNFTLFLWHIIAKHDPYERDDDDSAKISILEEALASKLAEFLDSSFPYSLYMIPSTMKGHLYKGPPTGESTCT